MGRATLGRIINVIGEPIDERGDISKKQEILPTYYRVASYYFILIGTFRLSLTFLIAFHYFFSYAKPLLRFYF